MSYPPHIIDRFWSKVDKHGPIPEHRPELGPCWIYTKGKYGTGYGKFCKGQGQETGAHQFAWEIENGPSPSGECVLHKCDVRTCVRNDGENSHLFSGTKKRNSEDMVAKRRHGSITRPDRVPHGARNASALYPGLRRGEKNGRAKLTWALVQAIRLKRANCGTTYEKLALEFGVSVSLIGQIVKHQIWKGAEAA